MDRTPETSARRAPRPTTRVGTRGVGSTRSAPQQPLRAVRLARIVEIVEADGAVRTADVARRFGVSEMTARRDLAAVADEQGYTRVHGGLLRTGSWRPGGR